MGAYIHSPLAVWNGKNIFPRIIHKNEIKTNKCKKYVSSFTDSCRTDDNYSYSAEKLL
jgi:hypothetical protein